ncbi:MAG: SCP2 sterol-binding domain-containing protein [Deltaproteobacteria bacterium]|jgi:Fe-S-cluster-containing hydrogenase component 2|nr:SCP2 sterol-binding domain-containing protein [Deltaproteobacteria bacterium]
MVQKNHPDIIWFNEHSDDTRQSSTNKKIEYSYLKELAAKAGANDCGITDINSPELVEEKRDILSIYPVTRSLLSVVTNLNRENVRCVSRSVSDLEFMTGMEKSNEVLKKLARMLKQKNINSVHPSAGFPMDLTKWPGKMWQVSHKIVAIAAGLGQLGHNRLLIHPVFGNYIILGTLLIDQEVSEYDKPLDYNPCIKCQLCVSACPTGAIGSDGSFAFVNCMTHNYRDRLGGFSDWMENIIKSKSVKQYRQKVSDSETVSMWQSLSYGICNKSSYCMAVCPAGKDNIGQFLTEKKTYIKNVVKPLQENTETIYVIPESDAQVYVKKKYPHKKLKVVGSGIRPATVVSFIDSLELSFQKGRSKGLEATYHFTFTGDEQIKASVDIKNMKLSVEYGHIGKPDISIIADTVTWLSFLAKEKNLLLALIQRKIKIKGSPVLMKRFAKCFPL